MNCAFRSPPGTYRLIMPRFLKLWLYARAFVTRYPGFLRLRGSPCFSLALYGIICVGFMMVCFYTIRPNFAIPPSEQSLFVGDESSPPHIGPYSSFHPYRDRTAITPHSTLRGVFQPE